MTSEIEKVDAVSSPAHARIAAPPAAPPEHFVPRVDPALAPRPHFVRDSLAKHPGSPCGHHSRGITSIGPQYGIPFPPTVGQRSLSLSPSHGGSRQRGAPDSSLLLPGFKMPFMAAESNLVSSFDALQPPKISDTQKAMEAAVAEERKRAKAMEEQEKDLSADELRAILRQERRRTSGFIRTIAELRSTAVNGQLEAEINEEGRVNTLMRRLEMMQIEKGKIVNELEREEEMITNTLQKKLNQVRQEKAELQKLIEREHASNISLKTKLDDLEGRGDNSGNSPATDMGGDYSMQPPYEVATFSPTTLPPLDSLMEEEGCEQEEDRMSDFANEDEASNDTDPSP